MNCDNPRPFNNSESNALLLGLISTVFTYSKMMGITPEELAEELRWHVEHAEMSE